jgi:hypothetical protein
VTAPQAALRRAGRGFGEGVTRDLEALDAGVTGDLEAPDAQRPQYSPASDCLNATGSRQVPRAQVCR